MRPLSRSRDGRDTYCRECNKAKCKAAYQRTKRERKEKRQLRANEIREYNRAYREANRELLNRGNREYLQARAPSVAARKLAYQRANRAYFRAANARRDAARRSATPAWANAERINEFYVAADFLGMVTGDWYHVDHIVPLQSDLVCGLHCEANLQVLSGFENRSKSNRYWPDMPVQAGA